MQFLTLLAPSPDPKSGQDSSGEEDSDDEEGNASIEVRKDLTPSSITVMVV